MKTTPVSTGNKSITAAQSRINSAPPNGTAQVDLLAQKGKAITLPSGVQIHRIGNNILTHGTTAGEKIETKRLENGNLAVRVNDGVETEILNSKSLGLHVRGNGGEDTFINHVDRHEGSNPLEWDAEDRAAIIIGAGDQNVFLNTGIGAKVWGKGTIFNTADNAKIGSQDGTVVNTGDDVRMSVGGGSVVSTGDGHLSVRDDVVVHSANADLISKGNRGILQNDKATIAQAEGVLADLFASGRVQRPEHSQEANLDFADAEALPGSQPAADDGVVIDDIDGEAIKPTTDAAEPATEDPAATPAPSPQRAAAPRGSAARPVSPAADTLQQLLQAMGIPLGSNLLIEMLLLEMLKEQGFEGADEEIAKRMQLLGNRKAFA